MKTHSNELKDELRGVEKEKVEVKEELFKEKSSVEKLTIDMLQSKGKLNVRGSRIL
jgi:hypothetical protein